ncbi:MAG TPA: SUF system Fe-S cluster assembly regulator [Gammaproteobacteria bacterium]
MLRLSKMTDYGTVVLAHMARNPQAVHAAADVAQATHVKLPTVSKLLKLMTKGGLLASQRGSHGGYVFARLPAEISAADIIDAIEGGMGITECSGNHSQCDIEAHCHVGTAWQRIDLAIRDALKSVSLEQLAQPNTLVPPQVRIGRNPSRVIPIKLES